MIVETPDFINSEYVDVNENGWFIRDDAPEDLKKRFNEWLKAVKEKNNKLEE